MLSTCVFPQDVKYPVHEGLLHEGEPHFTNYGYAYAKRMLEVGARALRKQNGIQARCIIPCNVYGTNDNYNLDSGHVIPSLILKCYLAKRDGTAFHVWGSGRAEREFIYAPDIARAVQTIHDDPREIPNLMIVSPSEAHTIRSIVEIIAKSFDFKGEIVFDTSKPEGILRKPTDSRVFREWYPDFKFTGIEQGIQETCKFVEENYDSIRK
jgi:GDP-L-fucose synthase